MGLAPSYPNKTKTRWGTVLNNLGKAVEDKGFTVEYIIIKSDQVF